ncbi:MAG: hypothetical protein AB7P52_11565 [Alphaproteobacteria bacterium]
MAFPDIRLISHGGFASQSSNDLGIAEGPAFDLEQVEDWCGAVVAVKGDGSNPVIESFAASTPAAGTSHAITLPSGLSNGDLVLFILSSDGGPTITWPAGYAKLGTDLTAGSNLVRQSLAYRWCDGSESGTINVTTSASEQVTAHAYRISGADTGANPERSTGDTKNNTNLGGTMRCGAVRPSWTGSTLFIAAGSLDANPSLATLVGPLVYTDVTSTQNGFVAATTVSARRTVDVPAVEDMLEVVGINGSGNRTITVPMGWNKPYDQLINALQGRAVLIWRDLQSGDGESITVSWNNNDQLSYIALGIVDHGGELEASSLTVPGGTVTSIDPPSLDPSWGTEDTLWLSFATAEGNTGLTGPSGHTTWTWRSEHTAAGCRVGLSWLNNNAASEDPSAWGLSTSQRGVAGTIAIRPAAAPQSYDEGIVLDGASAVAAAGGLVFDGAVQLGRLGALSVASAWWLAGTASLGASVPFAAAHDLMREGAAEFAAGLAASASPAGSAFNLTLTAAIGTGVAAAGVMAFDDTVGLGAAGDVSIAGGLRLDDAAALGAAAFMTAGGAVLALPSIALEFEAEAASDGKFIASPVASFGVSAEAATAARLDALGALGLDAEAGLVAAGLLDATAGVPLIVDAGIDNAGTLDLLGAAALGIGTGFIETGELAVDFIVGFDATLAAAALGQLPSEIPPEPGTIAHLDALVGQLQVSLENVTGLSAGDARAGRVDVGDEAGGDWSASDRNATSLETDDEA